MIVDGLGYFISLAVINIINILIYSTNDTDEASSGVPIGYIVTWIMSQRILIRLSETSRRQRRDDLIAEKIADVLSRHTPLSVVEEISRQIQSQFHTESDYDFESCADGVDRGEAGLQNNSVRSSTQEHSHKGKRRAASDDSEQYLDSVIDLEIDTGISDRQTTVISGRHRGDETEDLAGAGREQSDPKIVHINNTRR